MSSRKNLTYYSKEFNELIEALLETGKITLSFTFSKEALNFRRFMYDWRTLFLQSCDKSDAVEKEKFYSIQNLCMDMFSSKNLSNTDYTTYLVLRLSHRSISYVIVRPFDSKLMDYAETEQ